MNVRRLGLALVCGVLGLGLGWVACHDDDGDHCADPCPTVDAMQCGGAAVQRCTAQADGCLAWVTVEDCAAQQQICLNPITGPTCGVLCTEPCSTGQSQCKNDVVQQCLPNNDGCLRWVDAVDCTDATQICQVVSGDATCTL